MIFFYAFAFKGAVLVDGQVVGYDFSFQRATGQNFHVFTICCAFKQAGDREFIGLKFTVDRAGFSNNNRTLSINNASMCAVYVNGTF